ncbi:MAG: zf-HC2 domain-containing protein [Candidatus Sulfotelmatobacter sp.]
MPDHTNNGVQCNEFDQLLADALDGVLSGARLERFQTHAQSCKACGELLAEAEAGRGWLKGLTEVEPPASLVTNILASTTGVDTQRLWAHKPVRQPRVSWLEHVQASFLEPLWAMVRQPRFAMSFGMAFFALSVGLTVAGVKPSDIRSIDLRPTAIRHSYYNTQARVVRYFDNVRAVYEVQAALHGIKRNLVPAVEAAPEKRKEHKNDTTQQPEQKQERNYSQRESQLILASARRGPCLNGVNACDLPVVSVTTYRRFV